MCFLLETSRLSLRPPQERDIPAIVTWIGDWDVAKYLSRVPHPYSETDAQDFVVAAGRNRAFGERVGRGKPAKEVAAEMLAAGELTEGYPAIASAWRYAREQGVTTLPLLAALHAVVWENAPVGEVLAGLTLG